ncbi:MAG TPA: hypothetical protein DD670_12465, partial [Planctomycetaceae bacterium]|nr:hypothetical protein [Planctomycetaceae bacterium]
MVTYTRNGEGGWTYEIHSSTAYSPDETVGLYDVAESSWSESHDAGSGTSVWTVTSHNTVTTWDDQWSDSFDSRYDHSWNESGLVTEDGLVAAYEEFESYDEEYRYDGTYQYEWDWWDETDENVEINTRDYSDYFTESLTDTWGFTYRESGVFGPGGEFGVYAYSESDATDYEYEGAGASGSQYEAEAYANCVLSQSETWDYDGDFSYRFTANDAGSFDEQGSIGYYYSVESAWGGTNHEGASQWSQGYDFGDGYTSSASGSSDDTRESTWSCAETYDEIYETFYVESYGEMLVVTDPLAIRTIRDSASWSSTDDSEDSVGTGTSPAGSSSSSRTWQSSYEQSREFHSEDWWTPLGGSHESTTLEGWSTSGEQSWSTSGPSGSGSIGGTWSDGSSPPAVEESWSWGTPPAGPLAAP